MQNPRYAILTFLGTQGSNPNSSFLQNQEKVTKGVLYNSVLNSAMAMGHHIEHHKIKLLCRNI